MFKFTVNDFDMRRHNTRNIEPVVVAANVTEFAMLFRRKFCKFYKKQKGLANNLV